MFPPCVPQSGECPQTVVQPFVLLSTAVIIKSAVLTRPKGVCECVFVHVGDVCASIHISAFNN